MPLTAAARAALYAESTPEQLVTLIEVNNPDGPDTPPWPFLICDDSVDLLSLGQLYLSSSMKVVPPDEKSTGTPSARVFIPGAPDEVFRVLDGTRNEPQIQMRFVMKSDPDTLIREYANLSLKDVSGDLMSMEFTLRYEELSREVYPPVRFSFINYPGGF